MTASPFSGIDHVGIVVRDVDASLPYYLDTLGMTFIGEGRNVTANVRLIYLDAGNMTVQLVCPYGPGPAATFLEEHGEGLNHVCFRVESIPETLALLAPGQDAPISVGGFDKRTCFLPNRPNGLIMELVEMSEAEAARD
ncbi:MAG: VOC family protein [Thermomicrobiales bacterium]|nr:VOC family protein [Thermomicrobiales bacterium]